MKNELKLNIIESIKGIEELVQMCKNSMFEHCNGINEEAALMEGQKDKYKLHGDVAPIFNELEEVLHEAIDVSKTVVDKEELNKCIEFSNLLHSSIHNSDFGQVAIKIRDFKSYVDRLVENDEHLYTTAVGQGTSSKPGKEPGDKKN